MQSRRSRPPGGEARESWMRYSYSEHIKQRLYMRGMTRKSPVFFLILVAASQVALGANPLSVFVPDQAGELLAGKDFRRSSTGRKAGVAWAPSHELADFVLRGLDAEDPDVVVEALYVWKKPRATELPTETLAIFNILRAVGTLQGIEYWSASRGRMRLFYEESWRVVSFEDRTPVPDEPVKEVPPSESFTVWQKDLSFGGNVNRVDYSCSADGVLMESTNLTRMSYGILSVAAPGALKVRVLALNVDEGVLFWVVSSARAAVVPGVRGKLEASFGNRSEAIFRWFSAKAGEAWKAF